MTPVKSGLLKKNWIWRSAREAYVGGDHPEVRAIRTVHRNIKADKKQPIFRGIFASY